MDKGRDVGFRDRREAEADRCGGVAVLIILEPSHKGGIIKGLAVAVVHKQEPAMGFGAFVGASQRTRKRGGRDAARRGIKVEGFVWETWKGVGNFWGLRDKAVGGLFPATAAAGVGSGGSFQGFGLPSNGKG